MESPPCHSFLKAVPAGGGLVLWLVTETQRIVETSELDNIGKVHTLESLPRTVEMWVHWHQPYTLADTV